MHNQECAVVYKVLWLSLWRKLSINISITVLISVAALFAIRYFSTGMSIEKTFQHISLSQMPSLILGVLVFCSLVSLLVAALVRSAAVEVSENELIGRNYWFIKKRIPFSKIDDLYPFNSNGIEVIVASGGSHGEIYIPKQSEKLDTLLAIIEQRMVKKNA